MFTLCWKRNWIEGYKPTYYIRFFWKGFGISETRHHLFKFKKKSILKQLFSKFSRAKPKHEDTFQKKTKSTLLGKLKKKLIDTHILFRYDKTEHRKLINTFVYHYLKNDGVFLIRLLAKNTNTLMTSEIVAQLWDNYRERHRDNRRLDYSKTPTGQRLNNDSNGMLSQAGTTFKNYIT